MHYKMSVENIKIVHWWHILTMASSTFYCVVAQIWELSGWPCRVLIINDYFKWSWFVWGNRHNFSLLQKWKQIIWGPVWNPCQCTRFMVESSLSHLAHSLRVGVWKGRGRGREFTFRVRDHARGRREEVPFLSPTWAPHALVRLNSPFPFPF